MIELRDGTTVFERNRFGVAFVQDTGFTRIATPSEYQQLYDRLDALGVGPKSIDLVRRYDLDDIQAALARAASSSAAGCAAWPRLAP